MDGGEIWTLGSNTYNGPRPAAVVDVAQSAAMVVAQTEGRSTCGHGGDGRAQSHGGREGWLCFGR